MTLMQKSFVALALILLVIVARVAPHLSNFAPVAAVALVSALYLGRRWAVILPPVAMLASDFFVGFYDWQGMLAVYGSFAVIGLLNSFSGHRDPVTLVIRSLSGSIFFFTVTNLAVWAFWPTYAKSAAGLMQAYTAAIPFFRGTVAGDLCYGVSLVVAFEVIGYMVAKQRERVAILASR